MSVSRTIRKRCALFTCVPGKSSWMFSLMTSSMKAYVCVGRSEAFAAFRSGIATKRGILSGTLTRANFVRLLCRTTTAKL